MLQAHLLQEELVQAPVPQAFAVFIREDPEAPWVFGEEAGGPRVGGLLHLELTLKQVKDQLKEAVAQLTDLSRRGRCAERRQQSQRPSFSELARKMQQAFFCVLLRFDLLPSRVVQRLLD